MKSKTPQARASVVRNATSRDTEEPQSVLGRRRYLFEASPGDYKDLGDDVGRFLLGDTPTHVA